MAGHLIVICGLPGAGKTTLARQLEQRYAAVRFNSDEALAMLGIDLFDQEARGRVERLQWEIAQRLLQLGQTVVIEWGTWTRAERDELRNWSREIGACVELRYLDDPLDVRWQRVQQRDALPQWGSAPLTIDDLRSYEPMFEPPDAAELALFDPPSDDER